MDLFIHFATMWMERSTTHRVLCSFLRSPPFFINVACLCQLSAGQQYRAQLARLLCSNSNIWFLDEFASSLDDATAVAAFLMSQSKPVEEDLPAGDVKKSGDAESGKATFMSIGCVACHQKDGVGDSTTFDGGLLDNINKKRTPDFWKAWFTQSSPFYMNLKFAV